MLRLCNDCIFYGVDPTEYPCNVCTPHIEDKFKPKNNEK